MPRRLLDPRNDLVFKRVFGEHPDILRAFLNAVLPLPDEGKIESLEYLTPEQTPEIPLLKNTIVDVRCRDQRGRQFIVEMQMNWTSAFMQRVLFNASKAYVRQLGRAGSYTLLEPVIGLSLLDDTFEKDTDAWFHHYRVVNVDRPERVIEGLQLVFIELPKFHPSRHGSPISQEGELWLRYLIESGDPRPGTIERVEREVAITRELKAAVQLVEEGGFSRAQLEAYDNYWDVVRRERTLFGGAYDEGIAEGHEAGLIEGKRQGLAEGRQAGLVEGKQQGIAEGKQQGIAEGRELGLQLALERLVASGMSEAEARAILGAGS